MRGAAGTLKKISLELGGKSPNIFFPDADWEAAVDGALFGVFINQGEVCSAGSRILVEKKIYPKFCAWLFPSWPRQIWDKSFSLPAAASSSRKRFIPNLSRP